MRVFSGPQATLPQAQVRAAASGVEATSPGPGVSTLIWSKCDKCWPKITHFWSRWGLSRGCVAWRPRSPGGWNPWVTSRFMHGYITVHGEGY